MFGVIITLVVLCLNAGLSSGFHTNSSLTFLVLGDWGGLPLSPYRTAVEKTVAQALGKVAETRGTQFQLALGDNFYFDGVKDVDDKRFHETFESVFTANSLFNSWYFVAGNHDWNGNASAEVAYSHKSKRWNYPSFYYSLDFTSFDGMTVQIVMIDTIILCGNVDSDFSKDAPSGPEIASDAEAQWKWIESTLKSSKADYLLVAGHFPVYSIAEHGPTKCLVDRLKPLLYKYNVSAYFNGHDHNLQHIQEVSSAGSFDYFTIGSANFVDKSTRHADKVPKNSLKFHDAGAKGGFAVVDVSKHGASFTFISGSNLELYQAKLKCRNC